MTKLRLLFHLSAYYTGVAMEPLPDFLKTRKWWLPQGQGTSTCRFEKEINPNCAGRTS